jgi:hypothetical protein
MRERDERGMRERDERDRERSNIQLPIPQKGPCQMEKSNYIWHMLHKQQV